jgi:hypothetical protein
MGRFSLSRLLTCGRYERLTSEDYLRLGLCQPQTCPDCAGGQGHYVKNDKLVGFWIFFTSICLDIFLHRYFWIFLYINIFGKFLASIFLDILQPS